MADDIQSVHMTDHVDASKAMYDERASGYDASNGGWHVDLGLDFVRWTAPKKGAHVLDLACGSGLVTYPAAQAVGPEGFVVGVDVSTGMLEEAKRKSALQGSGRIKWVEHDISNLDNVEVVQQVVQSGGFDLIMCCSALVLLANPGSSIKQWARFLRPGGRMIIDVPTEDKTVQHLWFNDLRRAMGIAFPFDPNWVKDIHSLENLYAEAGLGIEKSWRTRSYLPEKWYDENDAATVLEENIHKDKSFAYESKLQQAREVWPEMWKRGVRKDGKFWDGHALYVTIGVKRDPA